jgi:hypothetical protein
MREANSAKRARRPPGLIKARRMEELRQALRLWAAEFNRKARSRIKRARRAKAGGTPSRTGGKPCIPAASADDSSRERLREGGSLACEPEKSTRYTAPSASMRR